MKESDLYLLVNRWREGKLSADEAVQEIALSLAAKPVKKKRDVTHDVSRFMNMADAIVKNRK